MHSSNPCCSRVSYGPALAQAVTLSHWTSDVYVVQGSTVHTNIESLCCTPETNNVVCQLYFKKEKRILGVIAAQWLSCGNHIIMLYIFTYINIYMYVCTHICIYTHVYVCVYLYACHVLVRFLFCIWYLDHFLKLKCIWHVTL